MATNTYVALDLVTVGSSTPSVTFTSISNLYTDLVLIAQYGSTVSEDYLRMQFNSDTTTNYSSTRIDGNGTTARSTRTANQNHIWLDWNSSCENALTKMSRVNIMNYSNATTFKTVISRGDRATSAASFTGAEQIVGLWRKSPEAITTITLTMSTGNILAGSKFALYGLAAASTSSPKATGGTIYSDATYWYHAFGSSGTFAPNQTLTCDFLVVAGGAGGGAGSGGGGGAGGFRTSVGQSGGGGSAESPLTLTSGTYAVTIGGGGAGGTQNWPTSTTRGTNGTNSTFSSITSTGGGGGGSLISPTRSGSSGGSGGGVSGEAAIGTDLGGAGTANQGYAGGNRLTSGRGSGGGGAGSVGGDAPGVGGAAGDGGAGVLAQINNTYYAGGGGGGWMTIDNVATGGIGGIGGGGSANAANGTPGVINTGGGGAGGNYQTGSVGWNNGSAGGSGIVIIRYSKA